MTGGYERSLIKHFTDSKRRWNLTASENVIQNFSCMRKLSYESDLHRWREKY